MLKQELNKIKILTLLQLSEKVKIKNDMTTPQKLGTAGKTLLAVSASYGIFCLLFYLIFGPVFSFKPSETLVIFVLLIMQLLSIVSCTVSLSDSLYISRDNQMLLTYPVKHIYVYISKLLVSYILELRKSIIFIFPLFMAYGTMVGGVMNVNFVITLIIHSVLLPLFPVLLGAILSIPVVYFNKLLKRFGWLKVLLTIGIFVGLGFLTKFLVDALPENIRILALFNTFIEKFEEIAGFFNQFALYNNFIGKALYSNNPFLNNLFAILCLLGIGGIAISLSLPLFFRLASSANEHSVQKNHSSKNVVHKSTFFTFVRKELLLTIRNVNDFISNYIFLFILPYVLIILSSIYVRVDRTELGYSMTYGFIGLVALIMLSVSNTASATAISSEGSEFALLKTAPGKTSNIVWAKLLINSILSTLSLTISFVLLSYVLGGRIDDNLLWIIYAFILIVNFGLIFWSLQLDILNPHMKEFANSQNRGEIKNFSTSILIGTIASILFGVILIVVILLLSDLTMVAGILIGLAVVFTGIRLYLLINYMNAYFHDIEM